MSCLCIGGVCIPYTALLPVLIIGLQWIASQFAKVGLLPDFIAKRLGLTTAGKKVVSDSESCDTGCCGGDVSSSKRSSREKKKKSASRSDTTATEAMSDDDGDAAAAAETTVEVVEHIDNLERWQEIFTASKGSTLFVKFTADWCKPCKAIQPAYVSAATKHSKSKAGKFVTLDIDGDDCDVLSSKMKVAMMPTFVCFKSGSEAGRMSGGNSEDKLNDWIADMCDNGEEDAAMQVVEDEEDYTAEDEDYGRSFTPSEELE